MKIIIISCFHTTFRERGFLFYYFFLRDVLRARVVDCEIEEWRLGWRFGFSWLVCMTWGMWEGRDELLGGLIGWLVGWLVGRLVGRLIG